MSRGTLLPQRLFAALGDGQLQPGSALAEQLGVSRTAVWKAIGVLRALGVGIESIARQGYRAAHAVTPLDAALIDAALPLAVRARRRTGEVLWRTTSTNALLLAEPPAPPGQFDYRLAEYQSAGRGRRGRRWMAAPGSALCLSLSWSYAALPAAAGALSLAIGVAVWRVLRRCGVPAVRLKWPNDVLLRGRKLCGVLLELRAEMHGPAYVVVGIGLNCALDAGQRAAIAASGSEPADLGDAGLACVDRNRLAAELISEVTDALQGFGATGFAGFAAEWEAADALHGAAVRVHGPQGDSVGVACGIDADGALRVQTPGGLQRFTSGEVSVRSEA